MYDAEKYQMMMGGNMKRFDISDVVNSFHLTATQMGKIVFIHNNTASNRMRNGFKEDEVLCFRRLLAECLHEVDRKLGV